MVWGWGWSKIPDTLFFGKKWKQVSVNIFLTIRQRLELLNSMVNIDEILTIYIWMCVHMDVHICKER